MSCDTTDLIAKITAANANPGGDTLKLAADCAYVITTSGGPDGLPVIGDDLVIVGNGASIIRNSTTAFRILEVAGGTTVTLSQLSIEGGRSVPGSGGTDGQDGGGILNHGSLTLNAVVVKGNVAGDGGASTVGGRGGDGGGISNGGTLKLVNSTVVSNAAGSGGTGTNFGGVGGFGGGIDNEGTLVVRGSKIRFNTAGNGGTGGLGDGPGGFGGGIYSDIGTSTKLADSSMTGNHAGSGSPAGQGGGIYNQSTTITAVRTKIKNNTPDNCAPSGSVKHCAN